MGSNQGLQNGKQMLYRLGSTASLELTLLSKSEGNMIDNFTFGLNL
jgi:hypothetical protein